MSRRRLVTTTEIGDNCSVTVDYNFGAAASGPGGTAILTLETADGNKSVPLSHDKVAELVKALQGL